MLLLPPRSTPTVSRFPYSTLFRSLLRFWKADKQGKSFSIPTAILKRIRASKLVADNSVVNFFADFVLTTILSHVSLTASYGLESVVYMRSEEHTSELQSLMRISYAVFCWKKKKSTYRQ